MSILEGLAVQQAGDGAWEDLKEGLENKYKRLLRLEEKVMIKGFKLTEQQIRSLCDQG